VARPRKPRNDADIALILYGIVALCLVVIFEVDTRYPAWLPAALLGGLLLWLTIYHLLRPIAGWRVIFGFLQIGAGLGAIAFQFFEMRHGQTFLLQQDRINTLFLICGGIAVAGNGARDIDEGLRATSARWTLAPRRRLH
jgi:hypothetical protein